MIIPEEYREEALAAADKMIAEGCKVVYFCPLKGMILRDANVELTITPYIIEFKPIKAGGAGRAGEN